jgi:uncharacterized repeat protein (TIGR02543 family)
MSPASRRRIHSAALLSVLALAVSGLGLAQTAAAPSAAAATLPAKFDIRYDKPEWASAVRDQGNWGSCTMFGTASSAESSLLRNGVVPDATEISIVQMSSVSRYSDVVGRNVYGTWPDGTEKYSTSWVQAANAWAAWIGAQRESDFPYSGYTEDQLSSDAIAAIKTSDQLTQSDFHLRNLYLFPSVTDPETGDLVRENLEQVKQGIYQYGVLTVRTLVTDFYSDLIYSGGGYTDLVAGSVDWHQQAVAGWDDNYPATAFSIRPPGDGAFLVKNSWGQYVGDAGYSWVSYYDKGIGLFAYFDLGSNSSAISADDFDINYQYDLGYMQEVSGTKMANVFTVAANAPAQELGAVQFVTTQPDTQYKVTVYLNPTDTPETGAIQQITGSGTTIAGSEQWPGIHTVKLDRAVTLAPGTKFSVVVEFVSSGGMPTESSGQASSGQSFVYRSGQWRDVAPGGGNVNLKALARLTSPSVTLAKVQVTGSPTPGSTLTASVTGRSPASAQLSYQWYRDGQAISGARSATYTVTNSDTGHWLKAAVTGKASGYRDLTREDDVEVRPYFIDDVTLSGTPQVGQTMTVTVGNYYPSANRLTYSWWVINELNDIETVSASSSTGDSATYTIRSQDAGKTLKVTAYLWDADGKHVLVTNASRSVEIEPALTRSTALASVAITGTPTVGQTLTAKLGTKTPSDADVRYTWRRGGHVVGPPSADPTYTVAPADAGHALSVVVTLRAVGYIETSFPSDPVYPRGVFVVTFDSQATANVASWNVNTASTVAEIGPLPTVSENGYTFDGWYTEPTGGTKVGSDTRIDHDVTWYAHWTRGDCAGNRFTVCTVPPYGTTADSLAAGYDTDMFRLTPTFDGTYTITVAPTDGTPLGAQLQRQTATDTEVLKTVMMLGDATSVTVVEDYSLSKDEVYFVMVYPVATTAHDVDFTITIAGPPPTQVGPSSGEAIPLAGGSMTTTITTSVTTGWSLKYSCDWLQISPTSGPVGSTVVTMSAPAADKDRDCRVTVSAGDTTTKFTVDQSNDTGIVLLMNRLLRMLLDLINQLLSILRIGS